MKNLRNTKFYREMTSYKACAFAEGFCEGEGASERQQLIAWQWISDRGLWRSLQGFYGRTVFRLIEAGHIQAPKTKAA